MRKLIAFVRRGFKIEATHKMSFVLRLSAVFTPVILLHFASRLVDQGRPEVLAKYGGSYFGFALIGVALNQLYAAALRASGESLRRAQLSGVLEAILSTCTRPASFIAYDACYSFLVAFLEIGVAVVFSALLFGVDFGRANVVAAMTGLLFGTTAVVSLSIMSAAATLKFRKGDPIVFIFGGLGSMLSGVYFPTSLFPEPIRMVSMALPATHAIEVVRLAIGSGASLRDLFQPLSVLIAMTAVMLPLSFWCFETAVIEARRDGTLLHY